jgi:hypothetical protein
MTATRVPTPDLACIEPATAVGNAPVEWLTLPATDLGHHVVLRSFDVPRQRISVRLRGAEGCFAGYTRLELGTVADDADTRLTCVAVLVSATTDRQHIRFEAFLESDDSPPGEPSSRSFRVALGDGLVVAFR